MKQLKKIKLNDLNESELKEREMNALYAGRACSCSCSAPGGSSISNNGNGNYRIGESGGHSISGTPAICFTNEFGNGIQGVATNT